MDQWTTQFYYCKGLFARRYKLFAVNRHRRTRLTSTLSFSFIHQSSAGWECDPRTNEGIPCVADYSSAHEDLVDFPSLFNQHSCKGEPLADNASSSMREEMLEKDNERVRRTLFTYLHNILCSSSHQTYASAILTFDIRKECARTLLIRWLGWVKVTCPAGAVHMVDLTKACWQHRLRLSWILLFPLERDRFLFFCSHHQIQSRKSKSKPRAILGIILEDIARCSLVPHLSMFASQEYDCRTS